MLHIHTYKPSRRTCFNFWDSYSIVWKNITKKYMKMSLSHIGGNSSFLGYDYEKKLCYYFCGCSHILQFEHTKNTASFHAGIASVLTHETIYLAKEMLIWADINLPLVLDVQPIVITYDCTQLAEESSRILNNYSMTVNTTLGTSDQTRLSVVWPNSTHKLQFLAKCEIKTLSIGKNYLTFMLIFYRQGLVSYWRNY